MIATPSWSAVAPSNIAFIKYWGKRDPLLQWPANDSLSMTLSSSHTVSTARRLDGPEDVFQFADLPVMTSSSHPEHKIFRHLQFLRQELGTSERLQIISHNTFPTGCGIASSASGFAALTLAAVAAWTEQTEWNDLAMRGIPRERLAHLARRGSGSAGRSIFGGFVRWDGGASSEEQRIHPIVPANHWSLSDVIVVLSAEEKSVSSSQAHLAAWGSPLFAPRLAGIPAKMQRVTTAIEKKDIDGLGVEIESEALEMHAVAMTGTPQVQYFTPDTVRFLAWVRQERARGTLPAYFTVDAGPNVHLICETKDAESIVRQVQKEWPTAQTISDQIGTGPIMIRGIPGTDVFSNLENKYVR